MLFVCTGNVCRSPLAEAVLRTELLRRNGHQDIVVDSAGTHADHIGQQADPRMRSVARSHGITVHHRARRLEPSELSSWDMIFAMDEGHLRIMTRYAREDEVAGRILLFRSYDPVRDDRYFPDVPDPWYGARDGFERVYEIVSRTCQRITDALLADRHD